VLEINATLLVQVVNFIVFLAIMNAIFFKPVGAAIARRRAYIDGLASDIEQLQRESKSLRGQAEEQRAAARRAADEALAHARVDIGRESDAIVIEAQEKATGIVQQAHAEVGRELEAARAQESRIVDSLAADMLGRALGGVS